MYTYTNLVAIICVMAIIIFVMLIGITAKWAERQRAKKDKVDEPLQFLVISTKHITQYIHTVWIISRQDKWYTQTTLTDEDNWPEQLRSIIEQYYGKGKDITYRIVE